MKKLLSVVLILLMVVGCAQKKVEVVPLTVLAPKGAPAVGLLGYIKDNADQVTTVDGTDALTAAFTEKESEYDVIIAPVNLGSALINKDATDYRLVGILTWGNLYLISNTETEFKDGMTLASFGQNAVPEKVLKVITDDKKYTENYVWFNSVADVASALLSGKYSSGLVAEPVLSTIMKKDSSFKIIANVQEEYGKVTGQSDYPQAAIFIKEETYTSIKADYESFFKAIESYDGSDLTTLQADMDTATKEVLGLASSSMNQDTYSRMNVKISNASENKDAIGAFLKLFGITSTDNIIIE